MTERRDDLRATAEDIAQDARQLEAVEDEKLAIDPDDPRAKALSARAEELAEELHRKSLAERDLTDTASEAG